MLTGFMHAMSFIGSAAFYVPVLVVVYWCLDPRSAARAAVLLAASSAVNGVLKLLFHAPRPFWTDPSLAPGAAYDSFGMPSGHAQNAVVAWGFAASRTRRRLLWAAAAAVAVLIGLSRIYLHVHSVGQVLAGWAVGAVLLTAALGLEPMAVPWWRSRPLPVQLALSAAVSLAALGLAWAAFSALGGWRWPAAWVRAITAAGGSAQPVDLAAGAGAAGLLLGVLAGLSLVAHRGGVSAAGEPWRRAARVPAGAAGLLVIYTVGLFFGSHAVAAYVVQALLGLWAVAGAPEAFVALRLAGRPTPAITRPGEVRAGARP
ncbi:phosphatase PAP2 family protein [Actinomadura parmotrematis]|uniref:Phosphatase PAP2 family protein n=1 Tax=Actinomadura parmotrematis TaxID=2864039 RepID=A0ABS7FKP5_9ACTN|nr:phosphatase PAP2 family protein [Actinomadura parmotrematis]MBW8480932.1 phosphatase PAP2 family protein [Actinomadura parmotrematis]